MATVVIGRVFCGMGVEAVRGPHANRGEEEPGDEPEKIERQAKDGGIDAVPERDGETDEDERDEAEEERGERGFFHVGSPVENVLPNAERRLRRRIPGEGDRVKKGEKITCAEALRRGERKS